MSTVGNLNDIMALFCSHFLSAPELLYTWSWFTNMLLLRIHPSPCSFLFCFFFLALQYLSCCCDSSHILFQTVYFGNTASDTVQVPRQCRRDSCHISISCCFHGLPVLPFILCYHMPLLSHYRRGNAAESDTFLASWSQMLLFWNTIKSEKNTSTQNGLETVKMLCLVSKLMGFYSRFIQYSIIICKNYAIGKFILKQMWASTHCVCCCCCSTMKREAILL